MNLPVPRPCFLAKNRKKKYLRVIVLILISFVFRLILLTLFSSNIISVEQSNISSLHFFFRALGALDCCLSRAVCIPQSLGKVLPPPCNPLEELTVFSACNQRVYVVVKHRLILAHQTYMDNRKGGWGKNLLPPVDLLTDFTLIAWEHSYQKTSF